MRELHPVVEGLVAACLLVGALFVLLGALGLARMRDFYSRLHGPSKATTLGTGATLLGSMIYFSTRGGAVSLHELLITLFLFLTTPVGAHLMAKAALHLRLPNVSGAPEE
jgi:multicomponent K+:H+ antiporter subunit G